jgi:hypothetical protein
VVFIQSNNSFSSATLLLTLARDNGIGIIIGEPSGGKPCHYGDVLNDVLPNTNTIVTVSHKYFRRPNMELKDIIKGIKSKDYKERFKAEYWELRIRTTKLMNMLVKWDSNRLDFKPTCPRYIYDLQIKSMMEYLNILEARAEMEQVDLGIENEN